MDDNYKNNIFCNNCGKSGHLFHQCKLPITSIGILAIRKVNNDVEILLIRRKNSLGFVDFMRGKYNINNFRYIVNLFNKMSFDERNMILNEDFAYLWKYLWGTNINNQYKNEEKTSQEKLNSLKEGIIIDNKLVNIAVIIENTDEEYYESEWGFPKGRRNYQEKDISCAIREFEEETGYLKSNINIIYNLFPIEEIYTGSNYKSYKHKYYIAIMNDNNNPLNKFQETEISKIKWVKLTDAINYIRPYNIEKINIIEKIIHIKNNYSIYL